MHHAYGSAAAGFGVFGGGYGTLQAAMTGTAWMPTGFGAVLLLASVAVAKIAAASLTIGSGAAAGDFAPSLAIGGLVGAAFGVAARTVLADATIQPAAFALVGMGTFYGGLAHAPLSALVLVAELAGSYDLLVPMMLAVGIAYVGLRRFSLYPAQVPTRSASPSHRGTTGNGPHLAEAAMRSVQDLLVLPEIAPFAEHAPLSEIAASASHARDQRVVALGLSGGFTGLVELSTVAETPESERSWMKAHDARVPFVFIRDDATWPEVAHLLDACGLSQVPVVSGSEIIGWVGDRELRRAVLDGARPPRLHTVRR
jgi:CIC family chloride channel protein